MFIITGANGLVFHGPLEDLPRVDRIEPVRRAKRTREDYLDAPRMPQQAATNRDAYQSAVAAYREQLAPRVPRGRIYHAYQIMSRDVVTLPLDAPVELAWRTLVKRGIGQAPVVNAATCVVGLVAREHLLHVLNETGGQISDVVPCRVGDVMATPAVAATPATDVRRIVQVMLDYSLSAVPILDDSSALVGIVSRHDILRVVATDPPLMLWA